MANDVKLPCGRSAIANVMQKLVGVSTQGPRGSRMRIRTNAKLPCGRTASTNVIHNMMDKHAGPARLANVHTDQRKTARRAHRGHKRYTEYDG